ncbi:MAG: DUF853 family protein [Nanoarchaeota archaeon]|nr:DUF853 family protein [Nanoarchaeota archaeon]
MVRVHIGSSKGKKTLFETNSLTRHAAVLGTTGSGKTVLGKVLLEEVLARHIPVIAIDPKGDLGGLGLASNNFDFRPFGGTGLVKAERLVRKYHEAHESVNKDTISRLKKVKTEVYTPKSSVGTPVSLIPDLSAPPNFKKLASEDMNIIADFVEPVSESIVQLAGITGAKKEKAQSLISSILVYHWNNQKNISFQELIENIIFPPFDTIGSLAIEDFLKEKDRKGIAASVNLILSSPSKQAWKQGEILDMRKFLQPDTLSVFDLRFAASDKQFVVEQILLEIYRYLIRKGGTEKLKYVLYIDELAGLMPPPPANPPSKRLLELLIRQARAFGLGIIVATQSPGDVDYRIFGNLGTRFIGRLRTDRELEKVASAMDMSPSKLKLDVAKLGTGEFVYNDAVRNQNKIIKARWVYTYHEGPLSQQEIKWINNPGMQPKVSGSVKASKGTGAYQARKTSGRRMSATKLVESLGPVRKSKHKKQSLLPKVDQNIKDLITQLKKHGDKTQMKLVVSKTDEYVPHLRVMIEARQINGIEIPLQGPWVFDLTTRLIPLGNYLKGQTLRTFFATDIKMVKHKTSIKRTIDYCIREAKDNLRTVYYQSKIMKFRSTDRDIVENKNHDFMSKAIVPRLRQIENKRHKKVGLLENKVKSNKKMISRYTSRINSDKAKRMVKRFIKGKKLISSTKEMQLGKKRAEALRRENKRLYIQVKRINKEFALQKKKLKDKTFEKAHALVEKKTYRPTRNDLSVTATLILVPKRRVEI